MQRLDNQHQEIGRSDHHPGAVGLLDHVLEALEKIGIDGFGGYEHDGRLVGLAGDEVLFRNRLDVNRYIAPQPGFAGLDLSLAGGALQRIEGFEGELGIDDEADLGLGQLDAAIGTRAV